MTCQERQGTASGAGEPSLCACTPLTSPRSFASDLCVWQVCLQLQLSMLSTLMQLLARPINWSAKPWTQTASQASHNLQHPVRQCTHTHLCTCACTLRRPTTTPAGWCSCGSYHSACCGHPACGYTPAPVVAQATTACKQGSRCSQQQGTLPCSAFDWRRGRAHSQTGANGLADRAH